MTKGFVSTQVYSMHPLLLAIIIDLLKIIPFFDVFVTLWLQIVLWNRLDNEYFKWLNVSYDISFDLAFPPFGDIFPLNTVCVILVYLYKKVPYNV